MKTAYLGAVIIVIVGIIFYLQSGNMRNLQNGAGAESDVLVMNKEEKAGKYPAAKEISTPDGFINTEKITVSEFVGKKVVLLDFWTYSCINCQRTIPYLNAWHEKYKDKGLVIIGVHTPEFSFEEEYKNVEAAVQKFGIKHPVVLDNDYSTWNAYGNRYWPRKYLIDIDGFIVYDHIGEGAYDETEKRIQKALEERSKVLGLSSDINGEMAKPTENYEVVSGKIGSPEIYFGAFRNLYLGNGVSEKIGAQSLTEPTGIKTNILYLAGDWDFQNQFAENKTAGSKIIFRYQAKSVYFVASSDTGVNIKILRDGKTLGSSAGADVSNVSSVSSVFIKEDRLYKLIEDPSGYGEHTLEIIIEKPGLQAFTFTFG